MCFQDAIDLVSGHYTVNRNSPSPFELNGFESFSVSNIDAYQLYVHFMKSKILATSCTEKIVKGNRWLFSFPHTNMVKQQEIFPFLTLIGEDSMILFCGPKELDFKKI